MSATWWLPHLQPDGLPVVSKTAAGFRVSPATAGFVFTESEVTLCLFTTPLSKTNHFKFPPPTKKHLENSRV